MKLKDSHEMNMTWNFIIRSSIQTQVTKEPNIFPWKGLFLNSLLDHTVLPPRPLPPKWAILAPDSHVSSLVSWNGAFVWGFEHFSRGSASELPRRTAWIRLPGTSAGLPRGHLSDNFHYTFLAVHWIFYQRQASRTLCLHNKGFPPPASEMSDENFISQGDVYWSNATVILLLPKWEALLWMYLFAFNHSVILRWMV